MSQEYGAGGYVDPTEDMDPEEYALLCEYVQYLNDNNGYDDENYLGELLQRRGQTRNRTKSRAPPPQRALHLSIQLKMKRTMMKMMKVKKKDKETG